MPALLWSYDSKDTIERALQGNQAGGELARMWTHDRNGLMNEKQNRPHLQAVAKLAGKKCNTYTGTTEV